MPNSECLILTEKISAVAIWYFWRQSCHLSKYMWSSREQSWATFARGLRSTVSSVGGMGTGTGNIRPGARACYPLPLLTSGLRPRLALWDSPGNAWNLCWGTGKRRYRNRVVTTCLLWDISRNSESPKGRGRREEERQRCIKGEGDRHLLM